jgi:hypothetical protein
LIRGHLNAVQTTEVLNTERQDLHPAAGNYGLHSGGELTISTVHITLLTENYAMACHAMPCHAMPTAAAPAPVAAEPA